MIKIITFLELISYLFIGVMTVIVILTPIIILIYLGIEAIPIIKKEIPRIKAYLKYMWDGTEVKRKKRKK